MTRPRSTSMWWLLLVGLGAAALTALVVRGTFAHVLLVAAAVGLTVSLAAAGTAVLTLARSTRARWRPAGIALIGTAFVVAMQVVSLPLGWYVHMRDVADARNVCEALVPVLNEVKTRDGAYPDRLDGLLDNREPLPYLIRNEIVYVTDGESFLLSFDGRDSYVGRIHVYSSATGTWTSY